MRLRRLAVPALAILLTAGLATPALAYQSSIDTTFADHGTLTIPNSAGALVAADGADTIVVWQHARRPQAVTNVRKLDASGDTIASFAGDGTAEISPAPDLAPVGMAVYPDGRILLLEASPRGLAVVVLRADGVLDRHFSHNGLVLLRDSHAFPMGVAIDSQARILVAGTHLGTKNLRSDGLVYRLLPKGKRDQQFGSHGLRKINRVSDDYITAITVDNQDRPLVAGGRLYSASKATVTRLTEGHGRPDPRFGTDGTVEVSFPHQFTATSTAIGSAHGVTTVGVGVYPRTGHNPQLGAFRVDSTGELDPSYGGNGKALIATPNRVFAQAMLVTKWGAVVGGGARGHQPVVAALKPGGKPDTGISPDGFAALPAGADFGPVETLAAVAGQIVVSISADDKVAKSYVTRLGTGP